MFEVMDDLKDYGIFLAVTLSILIIAVSGLFFGLTYFIMDITYDSLLVTDCVIENNTLVSSCQDLFDLALFPFLGLKDVLIWASFFLIFGLVAAMLVLGYRSGKSPALMGVMVAFTGGITYLGILLSNMYRVLLENDIFRSMMVEFTVYNRIMLYFPWFTFFVGLFAVMLGLVNFQRTAVNTPSGELEY